MDGMTLPDSLSKADMTVLVELQKAELDRLLRENAMLHDRLAKMMDIQAREQVLRQQMQSMMAASAGVDAAPKRKALEHRARRAENRYGRLKSALERLVIALEKRPA